MTSFESAKQKCALLVPLQGLVEELMSLDAAMRRENDLGSLHEILDAGFSSVPQPLDAEKYAFSSLPALSTCS